MQVCVDQPLHRQDTKFPDDMSEASAKKKERELPTTDEVKPIYVHTFFFSSVVVDKQNEMHVRKQSFTSLLFFSPLSSSSRLQQQGPLSSALAKLFSLKPNPSIVQLQRTGKKSRA